MKFVGKLSKWNDERGFGFIEPSQGGDQIFVHISSFPKDSPRPIVGESLTFGIALSERGKKQAINVERALKSTRSSVHTGYKLGRSPRRGGFLAKLALPFFVVLCFYGYAEFSKRSPEPIGQIPSSLQPKMDNASDALPPPKSAAEHPLLQPITRQCDGRIFCSQMTDCDEAKYFLSNCPNTKMDGDNDGIPCESQHCDNFGDQLLP
ncbi:cold shock domain-containing protein [Ferriphaselus sp. R-1]|uniref:cold shock domain-containing protein n=1 Tax=Ferriphaselus sp. R-1 TaxID=1485544 RepID=UPI0009E069DB|nr:cold shock domain-containing protein [Ferriphaselus sp. R-1]